MLHRERFHVPMLQLRQGAAVCGVDGYQLLAPGEVHCRGNDLMDIAYRFGAETFRLPFCLNSVHSALGQQLFVELLQLQGGQLTQLDFADIWLDVVVDVASVGLVGRRPHFDFGVVLEPDVHPLPDSVLCRLEGVYLCIFLDGLFKLCFYLRLSLAQDVFVDRFASLQVPSGGVAALPSTVRTLPDTALTVGSAFCHLYHLHSATQHTTAPVQ